MNNQKKNIKKKIANSPKPKQAAVKQSAMSVRDLQYSLLAAVAVIIFICFHYSLHNQFLNWDDGVYIVKDNYIKSFSAYNLKMMLFHGITPSNYHPFAMVSLALNYHFSQLHPEMYYLTNILIHIANAILVFLLAKALLIRLKIEERRALYMAALCALWFGIHPMHVESVSWISERKDVLYTFFYLLGLLTYLNYIDTKQTKWYVLTAVLFAASCLSKAMAVTFPLTLITLDLLLGRKLEIKLITEKIVFFLMSLFFGVLAYFIQKDSGAVLGFQAISFFNRILIACYGYNMYLLKFILPFNLSALYPYPDIKPGVAYPAVYYAMPFVAALITAIPFYFRLIKKEKLYKITLFGISFYIANIIFVLQFISCGDAVIAERYSYVSYIGLLFMVVYLLNELVSAKPNLKNPVMVVVAGISVFLGVLCYDRTEVWHNPETFWTDMIVKTHKQTQIPYMNLGSYYADSAKYDKAYVPYVELIKLHTDQAYVYDDLAKIYGMRKQFDSSLYCFAKSLSLDSTNYDTYLNRAITYCILGKLDVAVADYNKAFALDSASDDVVGKRAYVLAQLGRYADALKDYDRLIQRNPKEASNYLFRGNIYLSGGNPQMAIKDYLTLLQIQPDNGECMYDLSMAYDKLADEKDALMYAMKASQNKYTVPVDYLNKLEKSGAH